jgi:hypothetical protein
MQKDCRCIGCTTQKYYDLVRNSQNYSVVTPLKVQKQSFGQENDQ